MTGRRKWRATALGGALTIGILLGGCGKKPAVQKTPATHPTTHPATKPATTQAVNDNYPIDLGSSAAADMPLHGPPQTLLDLVRLNMGASQPKYPATQPLDNALPLDEAGKFVITDPVYLDERGDLWITRADAPALAAVIEQATQIPASRMTDSDKPPPTVHFMRKRIVFIHWMFPEGLAHPLVFYQDERGVPIAVGARGKLPIVPSQPSAATKTVNQAADGNGEFDWSRAFSWNGSIVVPTRRGVALLTPTADKIIETDSPDMLPKRADSHATGSRTRVVVDMRGFMAWAPPEGKIHGSRGIVRFVPEADSDAGDNAGGENSAIRGKWVVLGPEQGWPADILYIAPLLDGSVMRIALNPADPNQEAAGGRGEPAVELSFANLQTVQADAQLKQKIEDLIVQLSDDSQAKRKDAFRQLQQYGPPLWPILEKELDNAGSAEARARMEELLRNRKAPTLGNMTLLDGKMRLLGYFSDGGALFYAGGGVSIPQPDDAPLEVEPAWITVRPSRYVELLPDALTRELDPDTCHIYAYYNEYIVSDKVHGPRRFTGNSLTEMLPRSLHQFQDFIGLDNSGRWLFRPLPPESPANARATTQSATQATTQAASTAPAQFVHHPLPEAPAKNPIAKSNPSTHPAERMPVMPTLIIDPRLPDATPRLPIWELHENAVGWDEQDWPCVQDAMLKTPASLEAAGWRRFDDKVDRMMTKPEEVRPIVAPPVTQPATSPSTNPTTQPASRPSSSAEATTAPFSRAPATRPGPPLLVDPRGNCYYGGVDSLEVFCRDGRFINWPLPQSATGSGPVYLIRAPDGRMFLFNVPGRVVRIRPRHPTPTDPSPFVVEAIFSHNVPDTANPTRIWLDPAGRIDIVYDGNKLAILFPSGRVPRAIADLMPNDPLEQK